MLVAGGDQMLIEKYVFIDFKDFCKKHFKKNRESKSIEFLQALKEYDRSLFRAIEKTVGKRKMKSYIGRLLRSIRGEGWLSYEEKTWITKPKWGYCTYCFTPLDVIYLIDIDHHQYCDTNCFDDHEAVSHYDSYADDYVFLFWDFEKLKERYSYFLNGSFPKNFKTHLDLMIIVRDIHNVLYNDDYSDVLWNGGDDGPVAREMNRMITILKSNAEKLEKLTEQCKQKLPETNERFAIVVSDSIMRRRKRPEVLRDFIHKHRKYRDKENKNKWITNDPMQRLNWHDDLTAIEELESEVSIVNEINCPDCNQMISSDENTYRVPDGYYYCEDCYQELDFYYKLKEEWL